MKKLIPLLLFVLAASANINAQSAKWVNYVKGSDSLDCRLTAVTSDMQENIFGIYTLVNYGTNPKPSILLNGKHLGVDYDKRKNTLIIKFNPKGQVIWTYTLGPNRANYNITGATNDNNGNIYIEALFYGDSLLTNDTAIALEVDTSNAKIKISNSGRFIKVAETPIEAGINIHTRLSNEYNGRLYGAERYRNLVVYDTNLVQIKKTPYSCEARFPPKIAYNSVYTAKNHTSISIARFDLNGKLLFDKLLCNIGMPWEHDFITDDKENLFIHGHYRYQGSSTVTLGDSILPETYEDWYYVAKLDSNANVEWLKVIETKKKFSGLAQARVVDDKIQLVLPYKDSIIIDSTEILGGEGYVFVEFDQDGSLSKNGKIDLGVPAYKIISPAEIFNAPNGDMYLSGVFYYKNAFSDSSLSNNVFTYFIGRFSDKFITVKGRVFVDTDLNEKFSEGDIGLKHITIKEDSNPLYTYTNDDGKYSLNLLYDSKRVNLAHNPYKNIEKITPNYYDLDINDSTIEINDIDFIVTPKNVNDLTININPQNRARQGRVFLYSATVINNGGITQNACVSITLDSQLTFNRSNHQHDSIKGQTIFWSFDNLKPYEEKRIIIHTNVSDSAERMDTLCSSALVNPKITDIDPSDNQDTIYTIIVGSYDPNIKEVNKPEIINANDVTGSFPMEYTIHFQNTGNDTAFKVVLRDIIDKDLKIESIEHITSSHNYTLMLNENNQIAFTFNDILLVDSITNEPESHGFVKYRVWTKDNPKRGDEFTNFADIYFDFNEPVTTNTTFNKIDFIKGVKHVVKNTGHLAVYPNPSNGVFTIRADINTPATLQVIDLTGKLVYTETTEASANGLETKIDINTLPQGIYFIKVYAGNETLNAKIIKN